MKTAFWAKSIVFLLQLAHLKSVVMSYANEGELSIACSEFASAFYKALASNVEGNLISSPLSAHIVLALLSRGAGGSTAEELNIGLKFSKRQQASHEGFKELLVTLNALDQVELSLANTVYIHEGFELFQEFQEHSLKYYNSTIPTVDFENKVAAATEINRWIEENTNKKISNVILPVDISEDTRVVLINAIYFKGPWAQKFDPALTKNREFYIARDKKVHIPTMEKSFAFKHGDLPELNAKFVEIPYFNQSLSMVIILPNEVEGLRSLEKSFEWNALSKGLLSSEKIALRLPRFKMETTMNLKDVLSKIGLQGIFADDANFSNMSNVPLKVNRVIQKAFIEVNEDGSEAAAASVVQMRLRRMIHEPEEFNVNHPFIFAIRHVPTNIPLFMGSVREFGTHIKDEL
ncbi:antichymotrypsin-2 isoform X2 [Orussus abietinus]|uniref:antichymotrypsin-2 isoform X2 n=1 Tax=Orussus abietinus TaxID=222816 RepID=UPI0006255E3D|nr:antichymotrypsin-2 isoform X2 [Orussus abietinus]